MARATHHLAGTVALVIGSAALSAPAVTVHIERQGMASALNEFARQSGLQVLYPAGERIEALTAPAVVGTYPVETALDQLLADSGLGYQFVNARTVAIAIAAERASSAPGDSPSASGDVERSASNGDVSGQREEKTEASSENASPATVERDAESTRDDTVLRKGIPEVLVRGSRSLNADIERTPDDIQPYVVFTRSMIESSGASSVDEFLRDRLTMNYEATPANQRPGFGNESRISLRGLTWEETLILIDGRRAGLRGVAAGALQPDLNGIPLSAIERIEVLPATASGIYGGSATAGVVNVVLRRDYSGIESAVTYETTSRGGATNRRVDINGVLNLSARTSLQVNGSYATQDGLSAGDRNFVLEYKERVANNLGSTAVPLGYTTNIQSTSIVNGVRQNLTLKPEYGGLSLNSPIAHVPPGYAGIHSDGGLGLLEGAGKFNTDMADTAQRDGGKHASLVSPSTVKSISTTLRHKWSDRIEGFLELSSSSNESSFRLSNPSGGFVLPATAPGNPFEQSILIVTPILGLYDVYDIKTSAYRGLMGAIFNVGKNWRLEADVSFDRNDYRSRTPPASLRTSTAIAVRNGEIDFFKDTNAFPVDLNPYVVPPWEVTPSHSIQRAATVRASGPLFEIPGVTPTLTMLAERTENVFGKYTQISHLASGVTTVTEYEEQSTAVSSVYGELLFPLISEKNGLFGARLLDLQLSGRYDRYHRRPGAQIVDGVANAFAPGENKEQSFNPTVGIRFSPLSGIVFRASWATGFRPPGFQLLVENPPVTLRPSTLLDPKRSNEPLGEVVWYQGGRSDLKPERSISRSFGFILTPRQLSGFRLSIDWIRIEKKDNVTVVPLSQEALGNEDAVPGLVVRAPKAPDDPFEVGPIVEFDGRYRNGTRDISESYDLSVDYEYATATFGTWSLHARATKLIHSLWQSLPFVKPVENVGLGTAPKWRGTATLGWLRGAWSVAWTARYFDDYWVSNTHGIDPAQGSDSVPSAVYHDLFASFDAGERFGTELLNNVNIRLGVKNVFDREPRFYASGRYSLDIWGDPRGATYYLTVSKAFCAVGC